MSQWQKIWNLTTPKECYSFCSCYYRYYCFPRDYPAPRLCCDWDAWLEVKKKSCFVFSREAQLVASCLWRLTNRVDEGCLKGVSVQLAQHSCSVLSLTFLSNAPNFWMIRLTPDFLPCAAILSKSEDVNKGIQSKRLYVTLIFEGAIAKSLERYSAKELLGYHRHA